MKAATERKILNWYHMLASIPILGYVYGPVSGIPEATAMVRWAILPSVVLSGLWMWKGRLVKKWWRKRSQKAG